MALDEDVLLVLRHDLHKIRIPGALTHKTALQTAPSFRADGMAAWMGRNSLREPFEELNYRKSLIFRLKNLQPTRVLISQHRQEADVLFKTEDAIKLHGAILTSHLLNGYSEARQFPYSSLKYHILLTVSLYYNLKHSAQLNDLYLCENLPNESLFQVIYRDTEREWALMPRQQANGLSKVYPQFFKTWIRRRKLSVGGDHQILEGILSSIGSWTVALAYLEDFRDLLNLC